MSTRSMIARKTDEGFQGVYHHWDGYPEALGQTLWQMYHQGDKDLEGMLALLIDSHPAGWSSINGVDWTQPIGYVTDYAKGREMNAPQCFCHGDRAETVDQLFNQDTECGAEFAYAFEKDMEKETDLMYIYEKQYDDGTHTMEMFGMTADDGRWALIKTLDLLSNENIDWDNVGSWETD